MHAVIRGDALVFTQDPEVPALSTAPLVGASTGSVHLDIQPIGIEVRRVGAPGLDLADLTGSGGPAGPVCKLQRIWLSHDRLSLAGLTRLLDRSGGRLGEAAGGDDG